IKNQESRIKNQESRIKNQLQTFHSNSIQSVELTNQGDLVITYQSNSGQNPSTLKNETLSPALAKIKENMEKTGIKKLTKEELEEQLRELEEQMQKLEQGEETKPKKSNLGLKIGIGVAIGAAMILGVILTKKVKKNRNPKQ
ncbi:MAG: hypothetical protein I3273_03515, partial [Candidatus Moeniiplasma glomeromycotorum]|nr:hypothetical protein [Candidatus Moeniiplasma glomeromycotorum]MCE8167771.1 hypothetical protein [Candidatus Moeniiplasma glomeromycotorum]MCE8169170.1 hypothetical protein [Candidatus Moeniiplasma glomeromycotorum]